MAGKTSHPKRIKVREVYKYSYRLVLEEPAFTEYAVVTNIPLSDSYYRTLYLIEEWVKYRRWEPTSTNWSYLEPSMLSPHAKRIRFVQMPEFMRIAVRNELVKKEPWKYRS